MRPEDLSTYHRKILAPISGHDRAEFLVETDDGYFIKHFIGFDPDGREVFHQQKIRSSTIGKLFKMECIDYDDANDPENGHIHSTFSEYDFEENQ